MTGVFWRHCCTELEQGCDEVAFCFPPSNSTVRIIRYPVRPLWTGHKSYKLRTQSALVEHARRHTFDFKVHVPHLKQIKNEHALQFVCFLNVTKGIFSILLSHFMGNEHPENFIAWKKMRRKGTAIVHSKIIRIIFLLNIFESGRVVKRRIAGIMKLSSMKLNRDLTCIILYCII